MIRLKTLIERVEILPDGNLRIPSINDVTDEQWAKINRIMVQKGYNMRGPDDCKRAILKFFENPANGAPDVISRHIYPAWVETIAMVLRLKEPKSAEEQSYDPKKVLAAALRKFGRARDVFLAGYILPSGALLNFSSGGGAGRDKDHREIANVYLDLGYKLPYANSGTDYMHAFMKDCGAIRIGGSQGFADLWREPTRQQANELLKLFNMFEGEIILVVRSKKYGNAEQQYKRGTSSRKILQDIVTFYREGEFPEKMFEGKMLDELKVKDLSRKKDRPDSDGSKFILAFRQHLFIMDNESDMKKVQRSLTKHPAIGRKDRDRFEDDPHSFLSSTSEKAPDIFVGEWYPKNQGLVVWSQQEIIPQTSLQVKKVAKQLGVKKVTYRYTDYTGTSDEGEKDIPVKKLIGGVPKVMYHGTSTTRLRDLLKYGLDPGRGRSQFGKRGIFHPEHIFMAATLEAAMYYSDNAVSNDRENKRGWESFPIIIEFTVPDPDLLVPDFDADVTAGAKPYYQHKNKPPTKTAMKAIGVSREVGKWGYKGRVPVSFFKWIYYYNPYHKKWHKSSPEVWQRLMDNYDMETISWKLGLQGYKEEQPKYGHFWQ
jgi:hypothetical protein